MARLLLVDDHRTFLSGTAMILDKYGFNAAVASNGDQALKLVEETAFDLYLFDLKLPGINGFQLTQATLERRPEARIVILTGEDLADHYDHLIEAGVCGMLEKSLGEEEFIAGIRLALQDLVVLPLPLARGLRTKSSLTLPGETEERPLTAKEIEVLRLIATGSKNKDIADRLFMSQRNVEYIISNIMAKLNTQSRQESVAKAIEKKWLRLEP